MIPETNIQAVPEWEQLFFAAVLEHVQHSAQIRI
jgi:hypothetical protein